MVVVPGNRLIPTVSGAVWESIPNRIIETINVLPNGFRIVPDGVRIHCFCKTTTHMEDKMTTVITINGGTNFTVGRPVRLPISFQDAPSDFTVEITGLPAGLSFSPSTNEITGTPNVAGSYSVTIRVKDADGNVSGGDKHVDLTVAAATATSTTSASPTGTTGNAQTNAAPVHEKRPLTKAGKYAIGIAVVIVIVIVWAILAGNAKKQQAPAATETPAAEVTEAPTAEPTEAPTEVATAEVTEAATAEPTEAPVVEGTEPADTCLTQLNASAMVPFSVDQNMDVGDGSLASLVFAQDATGANFVAIIEKGYSLDFESAKITGKFLQTDAGMADVICAGNELAQNTATAAKLYIGAGMTPDGWTKSYPAGWKMFSWTYQEATIEVPGSEWTTSNIALTDQLHEYGVEDNFVYCQLWNSSDAKLVYHVIAESDYVVSSPAMQGTCWIVTGTYDKTELLKRFAQMTDEVILRDNHPVVVKIFAGVEAPSNWNDELPEGWTSVKR